MAPDLAKMISNLERDRRELPTKKALIESALPVGDECRVSLVSALDKQAEAIDQALTKLREMIAA